MYTTVVLLALLLPWPATSLSCDPATHTLIGNPPTCVPIFLQQGRKLTSANDFDSYFGYGVALTRSGKMVAVAGVRDDDVPRVYVLERVNGTWDRAPGVSPKISSPNGAGEVLALSADGRTLAFALPYDSTGTVYIYARSDSKVWQEMAVLRPPGLTNKNMVFGAGIALSADGTWLAVGAPGLQVTGPNGVVREEGGTWVYRREGALWKASSRILGAGGTRLMRQGYWVALSSDGGTLAVGGPSTFNYRGAAWVFTRDARGSYKQQAGPLTGANGGKLQAGSLGLSSDGNTLVINAPVVNPNRVGISTGAYVFVRRGGVWSQQGSRIFGKGKLIYNQQGRCVSISGDGRTIALTAASLNTTGPDVAVGGAFVFVRTGNKWLQLGPELIGKPYDGFTEQGYPLSLSRNGRKLASAGIYDSAGGAVWMFARSPK